MTQEEKKILIIELTLDEVNTVISGLQELPAKVCNPLTNKIVKQAQDQLPKEENTEK